jgi:hypothetical protein
MFEEKILSIKMTTEHPKGRMNRYIKNGVSYGLNLPVMAELVVETPSLPKPVPEILLRGGDQRWSLPNISDGPRREHRSPEAHKFGWPDFSANRQRQRGLDCRGRTARGCACENGIDRASERGGGHENDSDRQYIFSNFERPRSGHGVTVIPAGANAEGTVSKSGEYSPEMTLTLVIVNGKSHSVTTASITFNEQISFPAGSEVSFHLVRQMEVTR